MDAGLKEGQKKGGREGWEGLVGGEGGKEGGREGGAYLGDGDGLLFHGFVDGHLCAEKERERKKMKEGED